MSLLYRLFLLSLLFLMSYSARAQQLLMDKINPDLLNKTWQAQWILHPTASATAYGVFHFRRTVELPQQPQEFIVHVSADNRYRLFVNGTPVSAGPARGDLRNWRYETVDLAPFLKAGASTLAAEVYNFGEHRPVAQISFHTAFILQGNGPQEAIVNTNNRWKVIQNPAYRPIHVATKMVRGYYVAGPTDSLTAALYPWGWEQPQYEDSGWLTPRDISYGGQGVPLGINDYAANSAWLLVPSPIPPMEQKPERLAEVVRTSGIKPAGGFLQGKAPLTVPARSTVSLLLDQSHLTMGYPELTVSGGKGSSIKITYAEALLDDQNRKGNRDVTEGKRIFGYYDVFLPDGGQGRLFRPLWIRTYRFVQLDVTTGEEPLQLEDYRGVFTAYPFERRASFRSPDATLGRIWDVGWRTARLCALETYMDCPYYEQLQYIGDTRVQALISLYVSGDDRLMRNAIEQFDDSRLPEGLTLSRYPSNIIQLHPGFSLLWVAMVHDYHRHRSDSAFTAQYLPGIESVLGWFERRLDPQNGLLGYLPWVNYVDAAPGFEAGAPPGTREGQSALNNLLFAYALDRAAELAAFHGQPGQAAHYRKLAAGTKEAVVRTCYSPERKLFAETPAQQVWTQHTNIMAVLTDALPEAEQPALLQRVLEDERLIPAQIYFKFYLVQALKKAGMGDWYLANMQPWENMLADGLTTFAEIAEEARSDCHAWSASPSYDLLATVCGIEPAGIGFKTVRIRPNLGRLTEVAASMPHPAGDIRVQLRRRGKDGVRGEITLPPGLSGSFLWQGKTVAWQPGKQKVSL
jgi:alpha-L-rhamnosidase